MQLDSLKPHDLAALSRSTGRAEHLDEVLTLFDLSLDKPQAKGTMHHENEVLLSQLDKYTARAWQNLLLTLLFFVVAVAMSFYAKHLEAGLIQKALFILSALSAGLGFFSYYKVCYYSINNRAKHNLNRLHQRVGFDAYPVINEWLESGAQAEDLSVKLKTYLKRLCNSDREMTYLEFLAWRQAFESAGVNAEKNLLRRHYLNAYKGRPPEYDSAKGGE